LSDPEAIATAVHWALGEDGVFVISSGDVNLLPTILDAAETFTSRPHDAAMDDLVKSLHMEPLFV
jgi:hypothetical protein